MTAGFFVSTIWADAQRELVFSLWNGGEPVEASCGQQQYWGEWGDHLLFDDLWRSMWLSIHRQKYSNFWTSFVVFFHRITQQRYKYVHPLLCTIQFCLFIVQIPPPIAFTHTSSLSLPSCRCFTCTRSPAVNTVSLACNTILFSGLGAFGDLCGECKPTYRHPLSNMLMWMTMLFCRTTPIKSVRSLTSVTPPLLISKWVCSCDWDLLQWLCLNYWL